MKLKLEKKKNIKKSKIYIIKIRERIKKNIGYFNSSLKKQKIKFSILITMYKQGSEISKKLTLLSLFGIKNIIYNKLR